VIRFIVSLIVSILQEYRKKQEPVRHITFADKIVAAMHRHGYPIFRGAEELNIVYVHDHDIDGAPNNDTPEMDTFNDACVVIRFVAGGVPLIIDAWKATVDPGVYYRDHPIVSGGTAYIKPGHYRAWQVGMHNGDHEGLLQTGGEVTVSRDKNKNLRRDASDWEQTGYFGINQHGPSVRVGNAPLAKVGPYSAGCLVRESVPAQREFMALIKTDPRYRADHEFIFSSTILEKDDI
jgi:hypothetical protein